MFLIASIVSVEVYGSINFLQNTGYGLGLLIALGMTAVPFKYCHVRNRVSFQILQKAMITLLVSTFVLLALLCLAALLASQASFPAFQGDLSVFNILLVLLYSSVTIQNNVITNYFRAQKKLASFIIFDLTTVISSLIAGIMLLVLLKNAISFILGEFIPILCVVIVTWWLISREKPETDRISVVPSYHALIIFSLPFLPMALSAWGQSFVERLIIFVRLTPSELGIYAFATQIFAALYTILGAVNQSIIPSYVAAKSPEQIKRLLLYTLALGSLLCVAAIVGIGLWLQTDILKNYQSGATIAFLRSLVIVPSAIQMHFTNVIAYQKAKHNLLFMAQLAGIAVSTTVSLLLLGQFRLYGIVIGSLVGYATSLLVVLSYHLFLQRHSTLVSYDDESKNLPLA